MFSDTVGELINMWRLRRGWNRERLAEECAALGMPEITPAVLSNIESGRRPKGSRRRMVAVDELVVIAAALGVPPVLLLVPYSHKDKVNFTELLAIDTEVALGWFAGSCFLSDSAPSLSAKDIQHRKAFWATATKPLLELRRHTKAVGDLLSLRKKLVNHRTVVAIAETCLADLMSTAPCGKQGSGQEWQQLSNGDMLEQQVMRDGLIAQSELLLEQIEQAERNLVEIRDRIRAAQVGSLPHLPPSLHYLADKTCADLDVQ